MMANGGFPRDTPMVGIIMHGVHSGDCWLRPIRGKTPVMKANDLKHEALQHRARGRQ